MKMSSCELGAQKKSANEFVLGFITVGETQTFLECKVCALNIFVPFYLRMQHPTKHLFQICYCTLHLDFSHYLIIGL